MTQSDYQRRFSEREAPLALGSLRGYRYWRINEDGVLVGQYGYSWLPGMNEAQCLRASDWSPGISNPCSGIEKDCVCGFYGYWQARNAPVAQTRDVLGIIEGTGTTVYGENGFRSAKAKIVALTLNPEANYDETFGTRVIRMIQRYGIVGGDSAIALRATPNELAREFPIEIPEDARDDEHTFLEIQLTKIADVIRTMARTHATQIGQGSLRISSSGWVAPTSVTWDLSSQNWCTVGPYHHHIPRSSTDPLRDIRKDDRP